MKEYVVRTIKRKRGTTYTHEYRDKRGKILSPSAIEKATKGVYIPPAHDDVKINLKKGEKILAIGHDAKGRAQYVYNQSFKEEQSKGKFQKMIQFGESYQSIMRQVHKDLYTEGDSKEKQMALILRLVTDCCFRIGSDKYAKENNSYGVTTIQNRHVKVNGSTVTIDFIGKKGVRNVCSVKHKKVSKELRTKKRCMKKDDKLFMYRKGNCYHYVKASDINRYLKRFGDFSVKDFRTWIANLDLISHLRKAEVSESASDTEKTKILNACLDKVAHKLHNTRSVCKGNYVDPFLVEAFLHNTGRFLRAFRPCKTKEDITRHYISLLKTNRR